MRQFDIWTLDLSPTVGSEQSGTRPCVILETNAVENLGKTTIIAPFTTKIDPIFSFDVVLEKSQQNGLSKKSKIKFRQIRVVDKSRLVKKIGEVEPGYYLGIKKRLGLLLDLDGDFL